jgi:hypothetical protein
LGYHGIFDPEAGTFNGDQRTNADACPDDL